MKNILPLALVKLADKKSTALDSKEFTIEVFTDLSKGIGTVDHSILLAKLQGHGLTGARLNWFRSYLFNRKQYVVWSSANSSVVFRKAPY